MKGKAEKWLAAKEILCIRLDSMGDVLMTSPAIRAVKQSGKGRKITLLTSGKASGIAEFIREIDEILVFDAPWVKEGGKAITPQSVFNIAKRIKQKRFDAAITFTNFSQNPLPSAMLAYLAGIPLRLGYSRENPYELLTDWVSDREPFDAIQHGVIRQLKLVAEVGMKTKDQSLTLNVPKKIPEKVLSILKGCHIDLKKPLILMHPGGSEARRCYPPRLFAETAKKLINQSGYQILITGTRHEISIASKIVDATLGKAVSLADKLSLEELIGLVKFSKLLISNNTGPVHIAAAVGTPVVVLYARTNPEHTPWKVKNKVLYFDVPQKSQSKNVLLNFVVPQSSFLRPIPQDIISAAKELL